ncbi:UDP-N-acetylmuramate dehydrogenase [Amphibacillus cookii]|uniref:UDP-N-acetylmuramate dehydrogenase n=1 Tax=Amphibacillus cookii TaxID=767787 RepID=UPI00195A53AB|nr:UDP-N-acetylmuramate dehydrogenase [Amphibacillus cookii]MBM7542950.1 UDP-N-acetylmuramate dehydrogenase [Amphibacillus cookii]
MTSGHSVKQALIDIVGENNLLIDELIRNYTYTKLGGKADYFVMPTSVEHVQAIVKLANQEQMPFTLLGNGSNLIVRDGGIRGIVMSLKHLNHIQHNGEVVIAQSGARIIDTSYYALDQSLSGLEFACGIPGTVGGALYMNAGAYGGEIKDCLKEAVVVDRTGEKLTLSLDELELDYRTSNIPDHGYIVIEARFQLQRKEQAAIKEVMDDLTERRESKQPLEYPSCGSVFKRPPGYFAGKLIQDSDLQGKGIGGAEVSTKHAGFIVNKANATAKDYIAVIEMVQAKVKENFDVELEREVRILGEE